MSSELAKDGQTETRAPTIPRKTQRTAVAREYVQRRLQHGLYLPKGPKRMAHPDRMAAAFRMSLESEVLARHGELSFYHHNRIQSATVAMRHSVYAAHWLKHEADELDTAARLALSREVVNGLKERDRILAELGLDKPVSPVISSSGPMIYSPKSESLNSTTT